MGVYGNWYFLECLYREARVKIPLSLMQTVLRPRKLGGDFKSISFLLIIIFFLVCFIN